MISGQGTVALELLEQLPREDVDEVFIPVGGGGLISGAEDSVAAFHPSHIPLFFAQGLHINASTLCVYALYVVWHYHNLWYCSVELPQFVVPLCGITTICGTVVWHYHNLWYRCVALPQFVVPLCGITTICGVAVWHYHNLWYRCVALPQFVVSLCGITTICGTVEWHYPNLWFRCVALPQFVVP